jgi:hypothetical protein
MNKTNLLTKVGLTSFICGAMAVLLIAATGQKYSDYPNTATLADTDLFLVAQPGVTNKAIRWNQLAPLIFTWPSTNTLTAGNASITNSLKADSATITNSATVTNTLTAGNINVKTNLNADTAVVTNTLTAGSANITTNLTTGSANITTNLNANSATVTNAINGLAGFLIYGDANKTNAIFYDLNGLLITNAIGSFYFKGGSRLSLTNLQFGGFLNYSNGALTLNCPSSSAPALVVNTNCLIVTTNGKVQIGSNFIYTASTFDFVDSTAMNGLIFSSPSALAFKTGSSGLQINYNNGSQGGFSYYGGGPATIWALNHVGEMSLAGTLTVYKVGTGIYADSIYATNEMSASTFTDRSDAPADVAEATQMLSSITVTNRKIDHSTLAPALWGKKAVYTDTGLKITNKVDQVTDGVTNKVDVITPVIRTDVVPDQTKRNLSMLVSALALDNQAKQKQIDDLLKRVEALEKR